MTPGARLKAAITILDDILNRRRAADVTLNEWARANRYAGSSDRRAIEARVYHVLRRHNECANLMGSKADPRALVLGSLRLDGLTPDAIAAQCADGPHAVGELSRCETMLLAEPGSQSRDPWVRFNYPAWLHNELAHSLADTLDAEMEAMHARAAFDLRINRLKTTRQVAKAALAREGIEAEELALAPDALRLADAVKLDAHDVFAQGWVEVQDAGSQAATALLPVTAGQRVIDLCAGAGGKTLALAARMHNKGQLLACDVDAQRLGRLAPRAVRAGATMIELVGDPYADHPQLAQGTADAVLVDAPCSGSGTWRRNPEARWTLDEARLNSYQAAQVQAMDRATVLCRSGGHILFVTCSLLRCEGEDQAEAAQIRAPHLRLLTSQRWSPAQTQTDGFYAALFRKT